ncbi:MAG TPA: UDP-N-acetylglucosamine 2-epimerase, partial [Bacteroidota bacterium]|nr:UDP-N-acetylglucosamine 2-epimerase [Bacteroidota bacterium]
TDSGGIQEETTYLGVPCITMRKNTERPITVTQGTNTLMGERYGEVAGVVRSILDGKAIERAVPALWDGCASERIADIMHKKLTGINA